MSEDDQPFGEADASKDDLVQAYEDLVHAIDEVMEPTHEEWAAIYRRINDDYE